MDTPTQVAQSAATFTPQIVLSAAGFGVSVVSLYWSWLNRKELRLKSGLQVYLDVFDAMPDKRGYYDGRINFRNPLSAKIRVTKFEVLNAKAGLRLALHQKLFDEDLPSMTYVGSSFGVDVEIDPAGNRQSAWPTNLPIFAYNTSDKPVHQPLILNITYEDTSGARQTNIVKAHSRTMTFVPQPKIGRTLAVEVTDDDQAKAT